MKRDMELVRLLLLQTEADTEFPEVRDFGNYVVSYHIALLKDAGLIEGDTKHDSDGRLFFGQIHRLTWQGHEFLDSMRNDTVWKKVRERFLKPGVSWTFDLLKEFAKQEAMRQLGLSSTQ